MARGADRHPASEFIGEEVRVFPQPAHQGVLPRDSGPHRGTQTRCSCHPRPIVSQARLERALRKRKRNPHACLPMSFWRWAATASSERRLLSATW